MSSAFRSLSLIGCVACASLLLLAGCQSDSSDDGSSEKEPDSFHTGIHSVPAPDLDPRELATRFMLYAHQGALLRSDHPLSDSLSVLMSSPIGGRALTVIDTFSVESVETAGDDDTHTVQVRVPHAVRIKSVTWDTSPPVRNQSYTLRIQDGRIRDAPHVVGWPAFQQHIRSVAPDEAENIIERMASALNAAPSGT